MTSPSCLDVTAMLGRSPTLLMGVESGGAVLQFPLFLFFQITFPRALNMVSLTSPLRNFKQTDLSLSRFMAVSRDILI